MSPICYSKIPFRAIWPSGCSNVKQPVRFRQALSIWVCERLLQTDYATVYTSFPTWWYMASSRRAQSQTRTRSPISLQRATFATTMLWELLNVFIKYGHAKYGSWPTLQGLLTVHNDTCSVTEPGAKEQAVSAAFEDIRPDVLYDDLSVQIEQAQDELNIKIADLLPDALFDCNKYDQDTLDGDTRLGDRSSPIPI